MSGRKALELIRQVGIDGLCESEGCDCRWFEIHSVHVEISCHKSEHSVRVWSNSMDSDPWELQPIADEVLLQIARLSWSGSSSGYMVRFCEHGKDHHNGRWEDKRWKDEQICCYCSKPRSSSDAYLCDDCLKNPVAKGLFPWGTEGDQISPKQHLSDLFAPLLANTNIIVIGEKELRSR